jgi:hypothetical protein
MPGSRDRDARGYGLHHKRERERWRRFVDAGHATCAAVVCLEPTRHIQPGTPWDLDHTDDRSGYRGPTHARCNRSAGGRTTAARYRPGDRLIVRNWGDPP